MKTEKMSNDQLVDGLGALKAKIAELTSQEKELKEELIARAEDRGLKVGESKSFDGDIFRCTIVRSESGRLDMDAVREKLSHQFIAKHTIISETTKVQVVARVRDKVKEDA